jgi:hypothetical protein
VKHPLFNHPKPTKPLNILFFPLFLNYWGHQTFKKNLCFFQRKFISKKKIIPKKKFNFFFFFLSFNLCIKFQQHNKNWVPKTAQPKTQPQPSVGLCGKYPHPSDRISKIMNCPLPIRRRSRGFRVPSPLIRRRSRSVRIPWYLIGRRSRGSVLVHHW